MINILYNLKCEMMKHNITQTDMSKLLGITKQAVNYKVNGINNFTFDEMNLIQETYFKNKTLKFLFEKKEV